MNDLEKSMFNPEKASLLGKSDSEKFQELPWYNRPQTQYLVSSLARGPINAAQVVREGSQYYSHHQNLEGLEPKEDLRREILCDNIILSNVFYDDDHVYYPKIEEKDKGFREHKNIITNENENKGYLFDFDNAFNISFREKVNSKERRDAYVYFLTLHFDDDRKLAELVARKAKQFLSTNFKDKGFFDAVLAKTGVNLSSDEFKPYFEFMDAKTSDPVELGNILFNDIVTRLKFVEEVAEKYLKEHGGSEGAEK